MLTPQEEKQWEDLVPKNVTNSAILFFSEQERIEALRWYFIGADKLLSDNMDVVEESFLNAFAIANHPATNMLAEMMKKNSKKIFDSNSYQITLGQMGYSRNVDNFITYLKDLLSETINAKPEILKSSEKEQLDFVLTFTDMKELQYAIKEKKIEELFYKGFSDISIFFEKRLNIQICVDQTLFDEISLVIQKRHLIVHNRGRISKEYLKNNPNTTFKENEVLFFDWQDVSSLNLLFQKTVIRLDKLIAEKYNLNTSPNYPYK